MAPRFQRAQDKLEDAWVSLNALRASTHPSEFRSNYLAVVNHEVGVTGALEKDGASIQGFRQWLTDRRKEMRADELLRYVYESRIEDFHRGGGRGLLFTPRAKFRGFDSRNLGPRPKVPPGSLLGFEVGIDGPMWILEAKTPRERRVPAKVANFRVQYEIGLRAPPAEHRGTPLKRNDPVSVVEVALEYYTDLVAEAEAKFPL